MLTIQNQFQTNFNEFEDLAAKAAAGQQSKQGAQSMQDLILLHIQMSVQSDILQSVLEVYNNSYQTMKQSQVHQSMNMSQLGQTDEKQNTQSLLKTPTGGHVGQTTAAFYKSGVAGEGEHVDLQDWNEGKLTEALINCKPIPDEVLQKASHGHLKGFIEVYKSRLKLNEQIQRNRQTPLPLSQHTTEKTALHQLGHKAPIKAEDLPLKTDFFVSPKKINDPPETAESVHKDNRVKKEGSQEAEETNESEDKMDTADSDETNASTAVTIANDPSDIPDWQKDPEGWVMKMLTWLISDRVLPAAYAELSNLALKAGSHSSAILKLNEFLMLWIKLGNESRVMTSAFSKQFYAAWTQNKSMTFWNNHPQQMIAIIKQFHLLFCKGADATNSEAIVARLHHLLSSMSKKFGSKTDGSLFKKLAHDFTAVLNYSWFAKMSKYVSMVYNALTPGKQNWNVNPPLHVHTVIGCILDFQRHHLKYTNVLNRTKWKLALNNFNASGIWRQVKQDQDSLSNDLTTLSSNDQTNVRISFYALTTKVNCASQLLSTVGQMLSALSQNERGGG